jgi:hypothetical protein
MAVFADGASSSVESLHGAQERSMARAAAMRTERYDQLRVMPMSLMGHFRQIDPLPTLSACPLCLR